jgi:hypothetical protein
MEAGESRMAQDEKPAEDDEEDKPQVDQDQEIGEKAGAHDYPSAPEFAP